jgi:hypothetical protein
MKRLCTTLAAFALMAPLMAAGEADVQRCRALAADAARLACYDALFGAPGAPATAPATAAAVVPPAPPAAAAAAAAAAPPAPAAGPGNAPAAAAGPAAVSAFGLPQPSSPLGEISSHIPGRFTGWDPNTLITLANGQVWQIADRSRGTYQLDGPKVKVRKGALGSFFLEIEGQNQTPRVRRVQ